MSTPGFLTPQKHGGFLREPGVQGDKMDKGNWGIIENHSLLSHFGP